MLVLSRQSTESIMIGDSIEVTVVEIKGDKVRIGISAPKHVAVHRKEVYLAIQEENRAAASAQTAGAMDAFAGLGEMFASATGGTASVAKPLPPVASKSPGKAPAAAPAAEGKS